MSNEPDHSEFQRLDELAERLLSGETLPESPPGSLVPRVLARARFHTAAGDVVDLFLGRMWATMATLIGPLLGLLGRPERNDD